MSNVARKTVTNSITLPKLGHHYNSWGEHVSSVSDFPYSHTFRAVIELLEVIFFWNEVRCAHFFVCRMCRGFRLPCCKIKAIASLSDETTMTPILPFVVFRRVSPLVLVTRGMMQTQYNSSTISNSRMGAETVQIDWFSGCAGCNHERRRRDTLSCFIYLFHAWLFQTSSEGFTAFITVPRILF